MNDWMLLEQKLTKLIQNSRRPDYISHAITAREWLLKLYPQASEELKMAAFGHDIERCHFERMTQLENEEYLPYKDRHAQRCADILTAIMFGMDFSNESLNKVHHLVSLHEKGGDFEADLIRDADSLSFMSNNLLGFWAKRKDDTEEKVRFMYGRASQEAKLLMRNIDYTYNLELKSLVEKVFSEA